MRLGIMQPYFFPYVGYFQLIAATDCFAFYDDVHFIKGGWINRNRLKISGVPCFFTLPVQNISSFRTINEHSVADKVSFWRDKFFRQLWQDYRKTPNYASILPLIEDILNAAFPGANLADFLCFSLCRLTEYLKIDAKIIRTSEFDYDRTLVGEAKIIHLCQRLGAQSYLNAAGGRELYHAQNFQASALELHFAEPKFIPYPQAGGGDFISGLSIIDLLMNCPQEDYRQHLYVR